VHVRVARLPGSPLLVHLCKVLGRDRGWSAGRVTVLTGAWVNSGCVGGRVGAQVHKVGASYTTGRRGLHDRQVRRHGGATQEQRAMQLKMTKA